MGNQTPTQHELRWRQTLHEIDDLARKIADMFGDNDPVQSVMILRRAAQMIEAAKKQRKA